MKLYHFEIKIHGNVLTTPGRLINELLAIGCEHELIGTEEEFSELVNNLTKLGLVIFNVSKTNFVE